MGKGSGCDNYYLFYSAFKSVVLRKRESHVCMVIVDFVTDFEPVELLDLETVDIPIPNIDKDLPIPYFDDSLDIEPNLGTLEIYDKSACAQSSPS